MFTIERQGNFASALLIIRTRIVWLVYWGSWHGETNQTVTGKVDVRGRCRVQGARQIARKDRPVRRLVAQLDANLGAVSIDQLCGLLATNQGHVVTGHQQLCRQQGAIRGSKDQNVARHAPSKVMRNLPDALPNPC